MKVLIVDRSKESRRRLVDALGQVTNIVILGAVAGACAALHAVAESQPDVVVADAALPEDEATKLVERIRRLERGPRIVVVTDNVNIEQRNMYLAAGVDRYVVRDSELRALGEALAGLTRRRDREGIAAADTERLLGRMTAGIMHDMNNHLAVFAVNATLLRRNPQVSERWELLQTALDSMLRLSSTLLAYAHGAPPPPAAIDLGKTVRDVLVLGARVVPQDVTIELDIAETRPFVLGIGSELEQLVLNLLINASEAMPSGGTLSIAVRAPTPATVMLQVADTGVGMPVDASTSTKPERHAGPGLGLSIVRSVVDRWCGELWFAPREDGGTRVTVTLPAVPRDRS